MIRDLWTPPIDSGHKTRWGELKEVVKICIKIATIFDTDGIDIHFLNRNCLKNVKSYEEAKHYLNIIPCGRTPLTKCTRDLLDIHRDNPKEVLLVIATDGVPTDNYGYPNLENFKQVIRNKNHNKFYVSFLACSDQELDIGYLNTLDVEIPNVDVLDDYISERKEVLDAQGSDFHYTFGDHVARLLLGPLFPEIDALDEKQSNYMCNIL